MKRASIIAIALSSLALASGGCGGPPQIGESRDAFKAVDALYTAVSLRDPRLVDRCEADLKRLRESSRISDDAFSSLESIIAEAKADNWEPAQERLSHFMEGQRGGPRL